MASPTQFCAADSCTEKEIVTKDGSCQICPMGTKPDEENKECIKVIECEVNEIKWSGGCTPC